MFFAWLGFIGAKRNMGRSILAITAMAMAAGFLTYVISLSRGYPFSYRAEYRAIHGGEIALYDRQLLGGIEETEYFFTLRGLPHTDLSVMMPELYEGGYLSASEKGVPFTEDTLQRIGALSNVQGVYPRYQIPALSSGLYDVWATPLRGRDIQLDSLQSIAPSGIISEGRWFTEQDAGDYVCIVSKYQHFPVGQPAPRVGDTITVLVPQLQGADYRVDYLDLLPIQLRVIGIVDIRMRPLTYTTVDDFGILTENNEVTTYMQCDEIQIPLTTWQSIWSTRSDEEYLPSQLSLMVSDMSYLQDIVLEVQNAFPEYTVFGIPQVLQRAETNLRIEDPRQIYHHPDQDVARSLLMPDNVAPEAMRQDLRIPMSILILINAAMVMASNLLIMVSERRKEIGILKAVGARRWQIAQMILCEALLISGFGALLGFSFFRLPALLNQMTNRVAMIRLLQTLASDLGVVLGATAVFTLIFGLLPAMQMAALSVQEVLQSE